MKKNTGDNVKTREDKIEKLKDIAIIILSIILLVYLILGITSMLHGDKMGFFNLRFYIMSSDSEETNSSLGDLVVAKKIKAKKIKKDDNIIYKRNNHVYAKKVIKTESQEEIKIYVEKISTSSNENSIEQIENDEIMAKVLFKVRGIGNIAVFIKSPLGLLNMIMIGLCIVIILKKMKRNEQDEDNDDEDEERKNSNQNIVIESSHTENKGNAQYEKNPDNEKSTETKIED